MSRAAGQRLKQPGYSGNKLHLTAEQKALEADWFAMQQRSRAKPNRGPHMKQGLALLRSVCRDLGRDRAFHNDVCSHADYTVESARFIDPDASGMHFETEERRQRWLGEMRTQKLCEVTPGGQFLSMLFDATGEPYLTEEIVRAWRLDGKFWRPELRRAKVTAWGEPERTGIVEHALHELRCKGWNRRGPIPRGLRNLVFCKVAARLGVETASFEAAIAEVEKAFNAAKDRGFADHPFRHTAIVGELTIRAAPGVLMRDPTTMTLLASGLDHQVLNSTHWRRAIHCGDAVLVG